MKGLSIFGQIHNKIILAFLAITLVNAASAPNSKRNSPTVDMATIERIVGMKGKSNNGEYKFAIPQNDLSVMVDGFKIIPPMD